MSQAVGEMFLSTQDIPSRRTDQATPIGKLPAPKDSNNTASFDSFQRCSKTIEQSNNIKKDQEKEGWSNGPPDYLMALYVHARQEETCFTKTQYSG